MESCFIQKYGSKYLFQTLAKMTENTAYLVQQAANMSILLQLYIQKSLGMKQISDPNVIQMV